MNGDEKSLIAEQLKKRVAGVEELLAKLEEGDMDENEIQAFLKETLKVDWETKIQSQYRLHWLLSTGLVRKSGNRYFISNM